LLAFEGDSITDFNVNGGRNGYPWLAYSRTGVSTFFYDFAVSGSGVATMVTRASLIDAKYDPGKTNNVLFILIGANNLGSGNAVSFVASLKTYCQARQAVGWKVVIATILPRTLAGFNVDRNVANSLIVADPSFYDGLARFDLDAAMGCDACAANTTYYPDGTHPSAAGHAILGPIANAAIYAVLNL